MKPPPPHFAYPTKDSFLSACSGICTPSEMVELSTHLESKRPAVSSIRSLAVSTGFSRSFLVTMAVRPHRYYRRFELRKGRSTRTIHSPRVALKIIQKWFGHYLSHACNLAPHVYGFVPGRSAIDAARAHCPSQWICSIDVQNFFGSVSQARVSHSLELNGYSVDAIKILLPLLTLDQCLPQGSPASPILANLAFAECDARLERWARQHSFRITRYADDITVSSDRPIPRDMAVDCELVALVESCGWVINKQKTVLYNDPERCVVLGLKTGGTRPRLSKRIRNRLRAIEHLLESKPRSELRFNVARYEGLLAYSSAVEREA